jgi:hypothetical protein
VSTGDFQEASEPALVAAALVVVYIILGMLYASFICWKKARKDAQDLRNSRGTLEKSDGTENNG